MAVDLLVTPISRYWSGAYITPAMEEAWESEGICRIAHGEEEEILEPGTPIGGPDAHERWAKNRQAMPAYVATLPYNIASEAWDETNDSSPCVKSVPHDAFGSFLDISRQHLEKPPSLWHRMIGNYSTASHAVNGRIFVRTYFEKPFQKADAIFGSLPVLREELKQIPFPAHLDHVRADLLFGCDCAEERNLPLIIDL